MGSDCNVLLCCPLYIVERIASELYGVSAEELVRRLVR